MKIEHPEVIDETTHKPKKGGLMDSHLGTVDRIFKCKTCVEGMSECPGHIGHIEQARPVLHPGASDQLSLTFFMLTVACRIHRESEKILECICVNCGKLKADIVSFVLFS